MLSSYERDYIALVQKILRTGQVRKTRNAHTQSIFGEVLKITNIQYNFPLLVSRRMFYKGVFGELAAILRKPKHIDDFTKWGCNYWGKWAKPDGSINVDYGNAWFEGGQIDHLKHCLEHDKANRRMIINGWRPEHLADLDLPCCHYAYQFYVEGNRLHMMWHQRSVDVMIGLPSDVVFAAAWLISLANEFNMVPGDIIMTLGDTHIYTDHMSGALTYLQQTIEADLYKGLPPDYKLEVAKGTDFLQFEPNWLSITNYNPMNKVEFTLHE